MRTTGALLLLLFLFMSPGCEKPAKHETKDYPISPVDFTHVQLQDGFWRTWVATAVDSTIPFAFEKCRETGRINNFIYAAGIREGKFHGRYGFDDSDLYKIIEGASYSLMLEPDPRMEAFLDTLVRYISGAQEEDGYLYTAWTLKANDYNDFYCCTYGEEGRFTATSRDSHEFYDAGHMYEAAVAHYLATGKRTFLDVAVKNANLIYDVCITQGHDYVSGHQEIEIGLAKLYRVTGDERYLELAKHLLDVRAETNDGEYSQSHMPVTEQSEAVGHAVRANYMYSAMADLAALTGDSAYEAAIGRIWENVVQKKLSVTGGVGASHRGEAYGADYELPNHPYNETCAAIANVYWNHRMFLLHGEAKYLDVLERTLYNGLISGLSLSGTLFFYPNTLRHDGAATFNQGVNGRSPWFDCSCCPSNLSRFVPSVAGYAYATRGKDMYVNLFMNSKVTMGKPGSGISLIQKTGYPWDGEVRLEFTQEEPVEAVIHIRIPGWSENRPVPSELFTFVDKEVAPPSMEMNGKPVKLRMSHGFAVLEGEWKKGDLIQLHLPMVSRIILANHNVIEKTGLRAVQYGPLVYCAEEIDNRADVLTAPVEENENFTPEFEPGLLGGVNVLKSDHLVLVPYYAWANRGAGKMNVWFRQP